MTDINTITQYLPHRYPFLFVDRVVECIENESIKAYKNLSINEPFFQGHFPENPVMPGVLIIEALAQACGVLGFKTIGEPPYNDIVGSLYMIAGINKARFRRPVLPGDQLWLYARKVSKKRGLWVFDCKAEVEDQLVAEAELLVAEKVVAEKAAEKKTLDAC